MSGHSKWATIKRHKAAQDSKRGKMFSVLSKEITIAAKAGGGDPEFNPRLRTVIDKARAVNMPNDNIERAVKKGTGELPGQIFEEINYEGYAPGGVGLLVEVTTDNKNRSASEVRSIFSKYGGNLAGPGALAFNFQRRGQILISKDKVTEDALMHIVLEAGADDVTTEEDFYEVYCPVSDFDALVKALSEKNILTESAEIAYIPNSLISISDPEIARRILKMIEQLEGLEDVKSVWANFDISDEILGEETK